MHTESIHIDASLGKLYGELCLPTSGAPVPLVILSHGFGGELSGNADAAAFFCAQGFAVFNFDFCGGGPVSRSEGLMTDMTVLTEARDLDAIIDRFSADRRFSGICLWGASQGGFVSAYVAGRRPADIKALVLEFPAFVLQDDAKARALPGGGFPPVSEVFGMRIGRCYNEDATSFDIYDVIGGYEGPTLLLHGNADKIVPLSYSQKALLRYKNAHIIVYDGQGHGFTGIARSEALRSEAELFHIATR